MHTNIPQRNLHERTGTNALSTGDWLVAQSEFAAALATDRDDFLALQGMSIVLFQTGRQEVAVEVARRAALVSDDPGAWNNYGLFAGSLGRFEEAERALRRSVDLAPNPVALHHLGLCLYSLGRFDEAVAVFDEALKLKPGDEDLIDQRGTSLLGAGRYVDGLIDNKIRWGVLKSHPWMHSDVPEWNGEALVDKSIIVLHEQGYGDTFQFVRFVPRLRDLGAARVVLSVRAECLDLLRGSDLADEVIGIRDEPRGGLGSMDFKCPMLTVPAHLGLTAATIPSETYIKPPRRTSSLPRDGRKKVGVAWAGKPMYAQDKWRSMSPLTLLPAIAAYPDISFYSLQQDERRCELWQSGLNALMTDISGSLRDWSETAAIVQDLDLVVTVDSAVAHLAGAMGKPVAIMLPQASCWRWLDHATTTTPWYPSARLLRQERQGDWGPAVSALTEMLGDL